MTNETQTPTPSPRSRRFGTGALAAAVAATAVLAAGGTWLLARPHDHAPAAGTGQAAAETWQCPMHPSVVQDHPGDCPICGMKLVKVSGAGAASGAGATGGGAPGAQAVAEKWQCPMHPSVVQDHPGDCPICGMKLVKVEGPASDGPAPEGMAGVTIDAARQQLIGLEVAHVERGPVGATLRTSGRVAVDETRIHHVNVKFSGFMERVYADFVGRPVRRGEPIFSIYSPELVAAQEEYLLALRTSRTLGESGALGRDGDVLVEAARRKLELWDVPRSEIDRIERSGQPSRTLTFYSPATGVVTRKDVVPGMRVSAGDMPFEIVDLSRVWVLADAYESDLGSVKVGMPATLEFKAFPDRTFQGRVAFIDPMLDPKTRTAKVRIEVPNASGELRPEMFGEVLLRSATRTGLRVPADAVIHSGTQAVVFVALPNGKFQPREVKLGPSDGQSVEVLSGVEVGDGVVTRANFLVDSESRLRASLAALPGGVPKPAPASGAAPSAPVPPPAPAAAPGADPHAGHRR
jgi:Cu(I)/Ag(I) efflux system membrane fusion protein